MPFYQKPQRFNKIVLGFLNAPELPPTGATANGAQ
jgi:hypothetical protein